MTDDLERFREAVLANPALQAELRADMDERAFVELVARRANQHGCALEERHVLAALAAERRAWIERDL